MINGIFDSHAHYDDAAFAIDRDEFLSSLESKGISHIIEVGADLRSLSWVPYLCSKYPEVYGAIGIHPDDSGYLNDELIERMELLSRGDKIVAIGEIGLDYYWNRFSRETQKYWFIRQLELAQKLELPVIIHSRDAAQETFDIIKSSTNRKGVIHCFSGSGQMADEYIKMGFYIGIGGVVTFKKTEKLKQIAASIPLDRLLIETDCPYLSPEPERGTRNDSSKLKYVAEVIAGLRGLNAEKVISATNENARRLFRI